MRFHRSFRVLLAAALAVPSLAGAQDATYPEVVYEFHSVVPLGVETLQLRPARQNINLLASAESHLFEGVRVLGQGRDRIVLASDGTQLHHYPQQISFRVTATAKGKALDDRPAEVDTTADLNQYLLSLRFRLKIFHGLDYRELEPTRAELIGVPADVPYDERIYQVVFKLDNIPLDERMILEVYDSTGERLTRFHLDMM